MLLRRNLTCFYCGAKSELKKDPRIRQFDCKECEATNYLDENGEITDPPVAEAAEAEPAQPTHYAHYIPVRSPSPNFSSSDQNLFCSTCLNNQARLTNALAAYYPPPSDPSYKTFEAAYPEYRRNLERRFPPVCANCAPRVQERIKAAGYAAKTDHLRRLLERPRRDVEKKLYAGPTWQGVLVWWAGFFWWVSMIMHMLWSVLGTFATPGPLGAGRDTHALNAGTCGKQAWKHGMVQADCVSTWYPEMKFAMLMALLTFWWNNKLGQKLRGMSGGRLVGLRDHLVLQVLMLVLRGGSWWLLRDPSASPFPIQAYRGVHLLMAFMLVGSAIYSSCVVKVDHTPRFSFKEKQQTLLEDPIEDTPQKPNAFFNSPAPAPANAFNTQSPAYVKPFPVNNLAQPLQMPEPPSPSPSVATRYTAFTTEATTRPYDDDERMDWEPTKPTYNLRPRNPAAQQQSAQLQALLESSRNERSPFYGTLPAAPISPAQRLRNPPNQPTFRKTPLARQKDFFSKLMGDTSLDDGKTVKHEDEVSNADTEWRLSNLTPHQLQRRRIQMEFAEPKLRLKEETMDTGLEAMFDSVFSIRDEPEEVRRQRAQEEEGQQGAGAGAGAGANGLAALSRRAWDETEVKMWAWLVAGAPFAVVAGLAVWSWLRAAWSGDAARGEFGV